MEALEVQQHSEHVGRARVDGNDLDQVGKRLARHLLLREQLEEQRRDQRAVKPAPTDPVGEHVRERRADRLVREHRLRQVAREQPVARGERLRLRADRVPNLLAVRAQVARRRFSHDERRDRRLRHRRALEVERLVRADRPGRVHLHLPAAPQPTVDAADAPAAQHARTQRARTQRAQGDRREQGHPHTVPEDARHGPPRA
mmetsp:Transcript_1806/g.4756  ORF Transcript_1806/g.4756 Transcript_1806/m.4756 type:complete len:201 (-) Transcript_1806:5-607(-)